ncbi:hypothetical protein PSTG_18085 [Puccinia striiformis f. sp. tritici PST-78]|uniref:Uncharacterized protein n=1 Tax=Puccinia striiformis f. sp. tritici PST-78 TaxID=1165861 RepID=A0A0L0UNH4_9BASI|nr:hypothetical protein PSTG_18085 [Puccinia striiformis f. sp. tritici PST-78]
MSSQAPVPSPEVLDKPPESPAKNVANRSPRASRKVAHP